MTSDEADGASVTLRRIAAVLRVTIRTVIAAGTAGILAPLAVGVAVGAGGPTWLWTIPILPLAVVWVGAVVLGVAEARERRFRGMRAAAEDLAAEQDDASGT